MSRKVGRVSRAAVPAAWRGSRRSPSRPGAYRSMISANTRRRFAICLPRSLRRPEFVLGLLIALELAEVDGLPVEDAPHVDLGSRPRPAAPLGGHGGERD